MTYQVDYTEYVQPLYEKQFNTSYPIRRVHSKLHNRWYDLSANVEEVYIKLFIADEYKSCLDTFEEFEKVLSENKLAFSASYSHKKTLKLTQHEGKSACISAYQSTSLNYLFLTTESSVGSIQLLYDFCRALQLNDLKLVRKLDSEFIVPVLDSIAVSVCESSYAVFSRGEVGYFNNKLLSNLTNWRTAKYKTIFTECQLIYGFYGD